MINKILIFIQVHESKGVKFITDAAVTEFKGENGRVRTFKEALFFFFKLIKCFFFWICQFSFLGLSLNNIPSFHDNYVSFSLPLCVLTMGRKF